MAVGIYLLERPQILPLILIPLLLPFPHHPFPLLPCQSHLLASKNPPIQFLFRNLLRLVPCLRRHVHQYQTVPYQVTLNELVQRRLCAKTGRVVDFQQVQLAVVVEHEIEPQHFEAHIVQWVVGLSHAVLVLEVGLACDYSLDDGVLDPAPVLVGGKAHGL